MNSFDGEGGSKGMDEYVFFSSILFIVALKSTLCVLRQCLTLFLVGMKMIGEMTLIWIS